MPPVKSVRQGHLHEANYSTATRQADSTDREKRHTSPCCYETTARNTHTMVPETSTGRRGLGRLRAPGLRIQSRLPGIQLDWGRDFRPGTGTLPTTIYSRRY